MKQSRVKLEDSLNKTRKKYDGLADEIERLESKLQKKCQRRSKLELRVDQLLERAYPHAKAEGPGLQACLIINPESGADEDSQDQLGQILKSLAACAIRAEVHLKLSQEYAKRMAREAVARQKSLVIVAGGDDTVEQVAAELVGSQTALGILPVGTMNNLARALGIPDNVESACRLLRTGSMQRIDVGWICHTEGSGEYFLETAGAGLSAIAEQGHEKGAGAGSSLPQVIREFDDKAGELIVELDQGRTLRSRSGIVTVANAPQMGAHVLVAPHALLNDGLFDVAVYEHMSRREVIDYLSRADAKPRHKARLRCYRASRVRITKSAGDGGAADESSPRNLELKVIPGALRVATGYSAALGNL